MFANKLRSLIFASVAVTSLVLGMRYLGILEKWELATFDQAVRLRPQEPPDPRLLIVNITDNDIQTQKKWPIPDAIINKALTNLEKYQPSVIGLDIYRDLPVEPGHKELQSKLENSDRIITVCKLKENENSGVSAPPKAPEDLVGFADILIDNDGIVRRGVLFVDSELSYKPCPNPLSFGFQLALSYLQEQGIKSELYQEKYLQFGQKIFKPLGEKNNFNRDLKAGSYQKLNGAGYQILVNYRSGKISQEVTLNDVLNNKISPELVRGKIILIGTNSDSVKDAFSTPYSNQNILKERKTQGVFIHAHIVSQIISSVLDNRPLYWYWLEITENIWIFACAVTGGLIIILLSDLRHIIITEISATFLLITIAWILFVNGGWIPLLPGVLSLILTSGSLLFYKLYQQNKEYNKIVFKAEEAAKAISTLQALINEQESTKLVEEQQTTSNSAFNLDKFAEQVNTIYQGKQGINSVLVGRYKLIRVLGSGGFALTYIAEDIQRPGKPQCVVKQLKPARKDAKFLAVARRLFQTEAEILEKLGRHPQIPQLFAYFEENNEFYLVEEFISGYSLGEEMPLEQKISQKKVLEIIKGVLQILGFIHHHHVIHRDLKPGNIIRRKSDGKLVLIDFGAVKKIQPSSGDEETKLTVAIGTRGYTPPEQFAGQPNYSSDIYALGMIAIQALTGIEACDLQKDKNGNIIWRGFANVLPEFAHILDQMTRYHFLDRYQSVSAVLQDILTLEAKIK
jgi:CHASE2 domain-containing sensor protein/tRNA A-37 threonylcarbamoyl transferase component Bud32